MGTQIVNLGADYSSRAIGFAPPVEGAVYWNYFGDSADRTGRNLIVGAPAASVVGSPVVNPGYVRMTGGSHFVQTGQLDLPAVTLFCVARLTDVTTSIFRHMVSCLSSGVGAPAGSDLIFGQSAQPQAFSSRKSGSGGADVAAGVAVAAVTSTTAFGFYVARMGPTLNRIDDKTRGLSASGSVAAARSTPNGLAYRIGSSHSTASNHFGPLDIGFAGIVVGEVTEAGVEAVYAREKARWAAKFPQYSPI